MGLLLDQEAQSLAKELGMFKDSSHWGYLYAPRKRIKKVFCALIIEHIEPPIVGDQSPSGPSVRDVDLVVLFARLLRMPWAKGNGASLYRH